MQLFATILLLVLMPGQALAHGPYTPGAQLGAAFLASLLVKLIFLRILGLRIRIHAILEIVIALLVTPLALFANWRMAAIWISVLLILNRLAFF